MVRLIDAEALMATIRQHDYRLATQNGSVDNGMFTLGIQQAIDEAPTVDSVEYDVLRKWLHENAINNVNVPVTMDVACEIIVERFDGLRKYASEIGERKEK